MFFNYILEIIISLSAGLVFGWLIGFKQGYDKNKAKENQFWKDVEELRNVAAENYQECTEKGEEGIIGSTYFDGKRNAYELLGRMADRPLPEWKGNINE